MVPPVAVPLFGNPEDKSKQYSLTLSDCCPVHSPGQSCHLLSQANHSQHQTQSSDAETNIGHGVASHLHWGWGQQNPIIHLTTTTLVINPFHQIAKNSLELTIQFIYFLSLLTSSLQFNLI